MQPKNFVRYDVKKKIWYYSEDQKMQVIGLYEVKSTIRHLLYDICLWFPW